MMEVKMSRMDNVLQKALLSRADLKAIGVWQSNTTLLRLEARKKFPRRLRIGGVGVCWSCEEIFIWLGERLNERENHQYTDCKT
jgi:predicted DNA-binding transcriptional regulator AlpA